MSGSSSQDLDWNAFAHRALVAAAIYGLLPRAAHAPVIGAPGAAAATRSADLFLLVDEPSLDAASFEAARDASAPEGVVAVVVASTSAAGLVRARLPAAPMGSEASDGFARAARWALVAGAGPLAPAASAARLREIALHAATAGLALVEPEITLVRGREPRSAIDRAILSTIALGATARPLLFVREGRAPRGGIAKAREERVLDGWIRGRAGATPGGPRSLFAAALAALANAPAPVRGKELLREARARFADDARARGERVTTSASDGPALAKDLIAAWRDSALDLYAFDPTTPLLRPDVA